MALPFPNHHGGFICHAIFVPLFVLCWVAPLAASVLLVRSENYGVQVAQMSIAIVCGQMSRVGDALGVAGTAVAGALTAGLLWNGESVSAIVGSAIWFVITWLNWGHRFQYSPAWTRFIFRMNMASYYTKGGLRGQPGTGALDTMRTSKTIYLFHPHGIVTCGFSSNGVWSRACDGVPTIRPHASIALCASMDCAEATRRPPHVSAGEFNERTTPKPLPPNWEASTWPGTIFFIAASLREPSHLFKLLCDATAPAPAPAPARNLRATSAQPCGNHVVTMW
jgi:hypothetical protein